MDKEYMDFLEKKKFRTEDHGFDITESDLPEFLFDYQKAVVRWALRKGKAGLFAGTGTGKCHGEGTKIILHSGRIKEVQNIVPGDLLMGPDSVPKKVLSVSSGYGDLFTVTPVKGNPFVCNADHILSLVSTPKQKGDVPKIINITVNDYLLKNKKFKHLYKLWRPSKGVDFDKQADPDFDPYIMGLWIGDGSFDSSHINTNEDDFEVIDSVKNFCESNDFNFSSIPDYRGSKALQLGINRRLGSRQLNQFKVEIKKFKNGKEKIIPDHYLYASRENRLLLLAGLLDSDGHYSSGSFDIISKYDYLSSQIAFLARSLGFYVNRKTCVKSIKTSGFTGTYSRCCISGDISEIPCRLPRKKAPVRNQIKRTNVTGFSIIPMGKGKYYGFTLDGDGLYLLEDFIVTHNTFCFTSWAQKIVERTNGKILVLAPLAVSEQICEMDKEYGFEDIRLCSSQSDIRKGINVTNYEKLHKFDPFVFDGVVLDESSIMKGLNGATRAHLIESFRDTKYKLSCSGTPSPNDTTEILGQSAFLGVMSYTEALATFFVHDSGNTSEWRLKGHAQDEFWKWVASWSVMFSKPSDIGFSDKNFVLPPLVYNEVIIPVDLKRVDNESIFGEIELSGIQDRLQVRKQTIGVRTEKAAEIANSSKEMFLVWCDLNDESKIVSSLIPDAVEVTGSDSDEHKKKAMVDFAHGKIRVLVSKSKIAGFGMNWQKCHNIVYVGLNDSWESLHQSVRRCWRFGQKEQVNVWLILSDKERAVLDNLKRKERDAMEMQKQMIKHMEAEMKKQITGTIRETEEYNPQQSIVLPVWLKTA